MRIIAKKILKDFWEAHTDTEQQLKAWYQETSKAEWTSPKKIKIEYPSASFLSDNRVVFTLILRVIITGLLSKSITIIK